MLNLIAGGLFALAALLFIMVAAGDCFSFARNDWSRGRMFGSAIWAVLGICLLLVGASVALTLYSKGVA